MTNPIQGLVPTDPNQAVAQISKSGSGIDALTRLATGNPHLVTNPGLLQALANGNASYGQASAINAFMAGLKLQQVVEHARVTGTQQQFTPEETAILTQMNVKYDDVSTTPQQVLQKDQATAAAKNLVVATDGNGREIFAADGTPVLVAKQQVAKPSSGGGGGFWHGIGQVFHEIAKPFNVVSQTLGTAVSGINRVSNDAGLLGDLNPLKLAHDVNSLMTGNPGNIDTTVNVGSLPSDLNSIAGASPTQTQAMRDAGYDPANPLSIIAYRAAGKEYQDTTNLAKQWEETHPGAGQNGALAGAAMVELAKHFADDPAGLTKGIETNQSLDVQQRAAQLGQLNGKDFQDLVARVAGAKAGIGNAVVSGAGLDPAKHPAAYRDLTAGIDLASAFAVDPLLVMGKAAQAAKVAQVGLGGFRGSSFASRINDVLLSDTSGVKNVTQAYRAGVQRGMDRFIGNVNTIRAVGQAGGTTGEDAKKLANAYADIRATTPGLEPLIGDFTGQTRVLVDESGKPLLDAAGKPVVGQGDPITNVSEAAAYLGSKVNYARLMSGRAAVEWNLMPGSLSAFGTRALLKAKIAPMVGRNAAIAVGRAEDAMKILPWANDAVDESSRVVAAAGDLTAAQRTLDTAVAAHGEAVTAASTGGNAVPAVNRAVAAMRSNEAATGLLTAQQGVDAATEGLASARRAAQAEVMFGPKMSGEIRANLLKRGTIDGTGFNPGNYLAAQAERAARRLSSFLPREQSISLVDSSSTDKVYKFLQLYTSRSDAALGAAKWAGADEGTRRAMIVGIQQQVMHAAGYGATEAGRTELDRVSRLMDNPFSAVDDAAEGQRYALNGEDVYDEPLLGGKPVHSGVLPGHVQTEFTLQSYGQLAKNAAQSALWRRTFGPMFQSKIADLMTFTFKTLQLMKPSTWTRNMVEGLGNAAFRGELGDVLRAKAAAIEAGAMPERGVSKLANPKNWNASIADKVKFAPLAKVGQWYRHAALRTAGMEDGLDYISRLNQEELTQWIHAFSSHHLAADLDPGGLLQSRGIINDGLTPQEITYNLQHDMSPYRSDRPSFERQGYSLETANGMIGADRWSGNLRTLINDFPEHAKVLMDAVKAGDNDVSAVVAHIKSDPQLASRIDALRVRNILQDDRLGTTVEARTAEERDAALEQLARKQVSVASGMMTGRDGQYLHAVDDYVRRFNNAPSASWLMDHVDDANRPFEILAPKYIARPPIGGVDGFARSLAQVSDKWYKRLVEDPIQHTTSLPVFLANYGKARYFMSDAEEQLAAEIAATRKAALGIESGLPLKRYSGAGEDISKPLDHGTHFNIDRPGESNIFESGKAKTRYSATSLPLSDKRVLQVDNYRGAEDFPSTGLSALHHLLPQDEFDRVMGLNLKDLQVEIAAKFPKADLSRINPVDGQLDRTREAYGALLARKHGYAAVFTRDHSDAAFDEYLALTPAAYVKPMSEEDIALAHKQIEDQSRVVADSLMKQRAVKMSWVRTEQIIDDPGLKTQLDVTGRNFFMYSRATQAMIRRWGQAIMQDPARLEQAALALHAAEHAGMIYSDKNGELTFAYPGSGPFINAVTKLGSVIPRLGDMARLPVTPDLTGKVLFAAPGLDNPLKMALSPIVNIPYRVIESFMPAAARLNMDEFDKFVNGPIGAGQIGSQFMPAALRNAMSLMSPNDRKSQWASAMAGAIANLHAADPNGTKGISLGDNPSTAQKEQYLSRLKIQTKSILAVRAGLGLFFPAPASLPTMDTSGSKSDAAFAAQGLKGLRDEYQKMLNDFGGDYNQANQLWAAMHPDKLVYETAFTRSTSKGAQLPADTETFKWLVRNDSFVSKYRASAAYFIPPSTGAFDSQAYQEEQVLGMRQKYTPGEFLDQVLTNQGGSVYWPSYDAYKAREKVLKAAGDKTALTNLHDAWAQYSFDFKASHPTFTDSLDASKSTKGNSAADTLGNLRDMLAHPAGLPGTVNVTALSHMVNAYDSYSQWRVQNRGGGAAGTALRNQVTGDYQSYMSGLAQSDPALLRLYNGVFRPLSPELVNLAVNNGG